MTAEELKKYKRDWMRKLRRHKTRVFIRIEGQGYRYQETYIEKPHEMKKCPFCTMLLDSWHETHPCERWVIVQVFQREEELN